MHVTVKVDMSEQPRLLSSKDFFLFSTFSSKEFFSTKTDSGFNVPPPSSPSPSLSPLEILQELRREKKVLPERNAEEISEARNARLLMAWEMQESWGVKAMGRREKGREGGAGEGTEGSK